MKILGIETSCDETAAAIVEDGVRILSNVVVSQIDIFKEYGGVIPEVAARSHLEAILPVVNKALSDAECTWDDIDAIAVTHAPGLLGSLLIGTLTARTLAILHNKPLYAVHHLKSHVYANWLAPVKEDFLSTLPSFPLLALVISGGHTQILYMKGHNQFEIIGTTRDDAVGECFDKVAKILGLPYPGGPSIVAVAKGEVFSSTLEPTRPPVFTGGSFCRRRVDDRGNALESDGKTSPVGNPKRYRFPHPKVEGLDFSFSGLKTAVLRAVQKEVGVPISYPSHKLAELLNSGQVADFAASFQKTAVDILVEKLQVALEMYPDVKSVVVAGGVSANEELRGRFEIAFSSAGLEDSNHFMLQKKQFPNLPVFFPAPSLSGDNGAMVAAACYYEVQSGVKPTDPYTLNIYPRISIED